MTVVDYDRVGGNEPIGESINKMYVLFFSDDHYILFGSNRERLKISVNGIKRELYKRELRMDDRNTNRAA